MDNKIREIILAVAETKTQEIENKLFFTQTSGYELNSKSYSHLIGLALTKEKVEFESLFDRGYAKEYLDIKKIPKQDRDFALHYVKKCKETPSKDFLNSYLSIKEQRKFLLRAWKMLNLKKSIEANSFTVVSSICHILKDYKSVGVNCIHLSPEIDKAFLKISTEHHVHHNYLRVFLFEGVYFNKSTLETLRKSPSNFSEEEYLELTKINDINIIKANHKVLDITLKEKPEKLIKRKI